MGLFAGFTASSDMKINFQGSLRGRLGFALLDGMMLRHSRGSIREHREYVYGHPSARNIFGAPSGTAAATFDEMRWGWTAGAGVEYAFLSNWTARLEYRYTNFSAYKNDIAVLTSSTYSEQDPDFHTIRIGASYRF